VIRATFLALILPTCALAQDDASPLRTADIARLEALDATAVEALLQALAGGSLGDVDLLQEILSGMPLAPLVTTLPGDWSCRTLKLGGNLNALIAYAPFDCTITPNGTAFILEKTSGSQQLTGLITLTDGRMILTGSGYVADTEPTPYADLPPENTSDGTIWPVVGEVIQPDPDRIRILMPKPMLESDLDILDLRRKPAPKVEESKSQDAGVALEVDNAELGD
jgi:hypothetical protein